MVEIVSRAAWGARFERGFGPAPLPASEVWLHHSATLAPLPAPGGERYAGELLADERTAMQQLEQIGEQRFGRGISYTFAVMPSGRIYEGHGVDRVGAHTANRNTIARAIVLVGNYDAQAVTGAQVRAVAELLRHGWRAGWWRQARLNGGHQQAPGASTACPGRHGMAVIGRINQLAGGELIEEDDMPTAREIADAILNTTLDMGWRPPGAKTNHTATLRTVFAWEDRRQQALATLIAKLAGQVASQGEMLRQLAAGRDLDLDAIADTTEAAVQRALADSTVRVEVDVTGPNTTEES